MKGYHHLRFEERANVAAFRKAGWSCRRIAGELGRQASTISRELRRNEGMGGKYDAGKADARAKSRIRGRPEKKIRHGTKELEFVRDGIMSSWSAERIAGRYSLENGGKVLSRQAISRFLYSAEARQLGVTDYATWQRILPKKRGRRKIKRTTIPDRTGIEERSKEAGERTEFGHWECDLVCFSRQRQVILHLVERKTRYGIAAVLESKSASAVTSVLRKILAKLVCANPDSIKSITFDNGTEFSKHAALVSEFGISTFFCHPYTSCEKGTVENANGILRRYLPRKTPLSTLTQAELSDIRKEMNELPMKVLKFRTPNEAICSEMLSSSHSHSVALHP